MRHIGHEDYDAGREVCLYLIDGRLSYPELVCERGKSQA